MKWKKVFMNVIVIVTNMICQSLSDIHDINSLSLELLFFFCAKQNGVKLLVNMNVEYLRWIKNKFSDENFVQKVDIIEFGSKENHESHFLLIIHMFWHSVGKRNGFLCNLAKQNKIDISIKLYALHSYSKLLPFKLILIVPNITFISHSCGPQTINQSHWLSKPIFIVVHAFLN